ncbi:MAG: hypothetical protein RLZZ517_252 [Candidatus Parcubacteria bacterium]|jgi:uncharacterized protein (TIGR00251 family)
MYIHIRIKTKQKVESIAQISETKFEVCVKEEAKQNRANTRMIELIKEYFKTNKVKIVSGHHSPSKLLSVE